MRSHAHLDKHDRIPRSARTCHGVIPSVINPLTSARSATRISLIFLFSLMLVPPAPTRVSYSGNETS